ncbi:conserved hypothetical protein [Vibrio phage 501E54-1]|nr:conserved hypothetical protein [Vibrio phage 501E54-1]
MSGYQEWKGSLQDMEFKTSEVIIRLRVYPTAEHVNVSTNKHTYAWVGYTVKRIVVLVADREKEYCGEVKILAKEEFGEYSEETYQEAVKHFNSKVIKHIQGEITCQ